MCRRSVAYSNKSELRYDSHGSSEFRILTNVREHYLGDLRPYICLHDGCSSRDTRYSTIDEWTSHIRTSHGQAWQCLFGCNELFLARTKFEGHMIAEHHAQFTSEELPTLTELCMKHTLATGTTTCPCCGKSINDSDRLHLHLAKHLEGVAILSLMPDLPCKFSANADPDLQHTETITSHSERESSVQSAGPIQQVVRGRTDTCEGPPGRARSASCWERGLGKRFHEDAPLGGTGNESFSSQGFRRHSWDKIQNTAETLAVDLDYPGPGRSEDAVDAATTSSSVKGAHESTSVVKPSILESFEVHDDQDYSLKNDPMTFEIDADDIRAIFSLEPGYQDLKVCNDDGGPVCVVKFNSIISAFRAAYRLNHCQLPSSNETSLFINFSGRILRVRVVSGPPLDAPLSEAVEQYPLSDNIIPLSQHGGLEQYQDYEQTDHASWETTTYA